MEVDYGLIIDFKRFVGAEIVEAERDGEVMQCILIPTEINGIYAAKKKDTWQAYFKVCREKPNPQRGTHYILQDLASQVRNLRTARGLVTNSVCGFLKPWKYSRTMSDKTRKRLEQGMADIEELLSQQKK